MITDSTTLVETSRTDALDVRSSVIDMLTDPVNLAVIGSFSDGATGVAGSLTGIAKQSNKTLLKELTSLSEWTEEAWALQPDESVQRISIEEFADLEPQQRFSTSDCLRHVPAEALALRGLISGLKSEAVSTALSEAFGESVAFKSADIARYRDGHYLRRHADTYEDRRFGLVFFISPGWQYGYGGELMVEGPGGDSYVIQPHAAGVAALRIKPGFNHQVAKIATPDWTRFSIATHFVRV